MTSECVKYIDSVYPMNCFDNLGRHCLQELFDRVIIIPGKRSESQSCRKINEFIDRIDGFRDF